MNIERWLHETSVWTRKSRKRKAPLRIVKKYKDVQTLEELAMAEL